MAKNKSSGGRGFYFLVGGVVIAGGAALLMARSSETSSPQLAPPSVAETGVAPSADAGVAMGSPDAPVTIVEFADYLCPHCRNFNAVTGKAIRRDFAGPGGQVRWINYDFPLNQASWAPALAARCAHQQGNYWQMHDVLYARSEEWATESDQFSAELANTDYGDWRIKRSRRSFSMFLIHCVYFGCMYRLPFRS